VNELRWDYAHGKLSEALGSMAQSADTLSERLTEAYLSYLMHLQPNNFPEGLRERVETLQRTVSEREAEWRGDGRVQSTIRNMHPRHVKKIIKEIASLEYLLAQVYYD
jgi:hypothetical protein